MSVLSRVAIAASGLPLDVKKFMRGLLLVNTVAATGSDETDAAALIAGKNLVTAADGTKGVILPVAEVDMEVRVVNTVSNQNLKVYPNTGAQINALTATTGAFTVIAGTDAVFYCDAALHWYVRASGNATGVATSATTGELNALASATSANATTGKAAILGTSGAITFGGAVTAVGSFIIGSADMSEADLEKLDGITNGTQAASKAIVNDTNSNQGIAKVTELHIGTSGSETQVTATAAELNAAAGVTLGTSAASKNLTTDAAESLVWVTTDATASETVTLSIQDTRTGAGATGWTHKAELVSNVQLGSYSNALYGLVTFGSSGSCTGLSAGVVGEVELSAGTTSGTYAALEAELTANAAVSTGTDTGFLYANIAGSNGTGKTTVNTNAHLMVLGTGVVDTADGLFDVIAAPQAVTASARLRIKIGSTLYYLPVCAAAALTS